MTSKFAYLALAALAAVAVLAQGQATVRSGAYTAAQATAGETAYQADCASCHGADLAGKGRNTPGLTGDEFLSGWRSLPLGDLFDKIQETMPADKPGQLPRDRTAAILAFLLKKNNLPAGAAPLPVDKQTLAKLDW